jgi:GxxExxY protein
MRQDLKYEELTRKVRDCAYRVFHELGSGFLERVYKNALAVEFQEQSILYEQQKSVTVSYRGRIVGEYVADMVLDNKIIVELKAVKGIEDIHFAQLFNYLKATGFEVGLLINFGPRFTFKRRIYNQETSVSSVSSVVDSGVSDG